MIEANAFLRSSNEDWLPQLELFVVELAKSAGQVHVLDPLSKLLWSFNASNLSASSSILLIPIRTAITLG